MRLPRNIRTAVNQLLYEQKITEQEADDIDLDIIEEMRNESDRERIKGAIIDSVLSYRMEEEDNEIACGGW